MTKKIVMKVSVARRVSARSVEPSRLQKNSTTRRKAEKMGAGENP